jgi:rhodanese-related sulfurtransferase
MKAIDAKELKKLMGKQPHPPLVNTLPRDSFEKTHIPESVNIPEDQDDFVQRVEVAAGGRDQPVIVYCASRECDSSEHAAEKLEQAGFSQVYDFESGAKGWQEAGERLQASSR